MRAYTSRRELSHGWRVAPGRIRVPFLIAGLVVALAVIFLVLPYPLGMWAETLYRDHHANVRQSGIDARVISYNRGWFSSDSTTVIAYLGRNLLVKSRISHGPFVLSGANASILPVAAAVQSTIDLAPAAHSTFKVTPSAPHLAEVRAIVHLGGAADISAVASSLSYSDAAGQTTKFAGGRWTSQIAGNRTRTIGTLDGLESSTREGNFRIGKVLVDFDGTRDPSGVWLGSVAESISQAEFRFSTKLPNDKVAQADVHLRDLSSRERTWREGSLIHADEDFSIAHADFDGRQPLSVDFGLRAANLDPVAMAGWSKKIPPMFQTPQKAEANSPQVFREYLALATGLAKNSPHATFTLKVKGSFGTVEADGAGGLKPAMASDPAFAKANGSAASWKLVGERYVYGSGEVKVPASLRALISPCARNGDWVSEGYIAQEGDYLVSHFKFDDGHLSLNGHQVF